MKVLAGALTDADREIVFESNRSGKYILVAAISAYVEHDVHGVPRWEIPMQAVGAAVDWDHDHLWLGSRSGSFRTRIHWEHAAKIWRRDDAPSKEAVDALLALCPPPTTRGDAV